MGWSMFGTYDQDQELKHEAATFTDSKCSGERDPADIPMDRVMSTIGNRGLALGRPEGTCCIMYQPEGHADREGIQEEAWGRVGHIRENPTASLTEKHHRVNSEEA